MFVSIIYGVFVSAVVSAVPLRCLCGASAVPLRCLCGVICFFVSTVPFLFLQCFCGGVFGPRCCSEFVSAVPLRTAVPLRCFCGTSAVPLRCLLFFCFWGAILVSAVFLRRHFWDQLLLRSCFCGASSQEVVSAVNY